MFDTLAEITFRYIDGVLIYALAWLCQKFYLDMLMEFWLMNLLVFTRHLYCLSQWWLMSVPAYGVILSPWVLKKSYDFCSQTKPSLLWAAFASFHNSVFENWQEAAPINRGFVRVFLLDLSPLSLYKFDYTCDLGFIECVLCPIVSCELYIVISILWQANTPGMLYNR